MSEKNKKLFRRIMAGILALIVCAGIVFSAIPTVHATEVDGETVSTETTTDTTQEESNIINAVDTHTNHGETDYGLTVTCAVPEKFTAVVYVMLKNDTTGQEYAVYLEPLNNYVEYIYLPADYHYTFTKVYSPVYTNVAFIMDTTGVTAVDKGAGTATFTMQDIDKIVVNEDGSLSVNEETGDVSGEVLPGSNLRLYATPLENVKMAENGTLYYTTTYSGKSPVQMEVSGFSNEKYTGSVKITKSGILGEAQYVVSLDGGNTYDGTIYTTTSHEDGNEIPDSGLSIHFTAIVDTDELIEGDVYAFQTQRTYPTTATVSPDKALMVVTGSPKKSVEYSMQIMSSGGLGISKIGVAINKEGSEVKVYTIPKDGIVTIDDNVQLLFKDLPGYEKGQQFIVTIDLDEVEEIDYTKLYILAGVVAVGVVIVMVVLMSKKEKKTDYIIRKYDYRQDDDAYKK